MQILSPSLTIQPTSPITFPLATNSTKRVERSIAMTLPLYLKAMQYLIIDVLDGLRPAILHRLQTEGIVYVGDLLPMSDNQIKMAVGDNFADRIKEQERDFIVYLDEDGQLTLNFGTRLDTLYPGLASAYTDWRKTQA